MGSSRPRPRVKTPRSLIGAEETVRPGAQERINAAVQAGGRPNLARASMTVLSTVKQYAPDKQRRKHAKLAIESRLGIRKWPFK